MFFQKRNTNYLKQLSLIAFVLISSYLHAQYFKSLVDTSEHFDKKINQYIICNPFWAYDGNVRLGYGKKLENIFILELEFGYHNDEFNFYPEYLRNNLDWYANSIQYFQGRIILPYHTPNKLFKSYFHSPYIAFSTTISAKVHNYTTVFGTSIPSNTQLSFAAIVDLGYKIKVFKYIYLDTFIGIGPVGSIIFKETFINHREEEFLGNLHLIDNLGLRLGARYSFGFDRNWFKKRR